MKVLFADSVYRYSVALLCTFLFAPLGFAQAQEGSAFRDGATTPPVLTHSVKAEYTDEARIAGFVGFVIVRLTVDERGIPKNVHVVRPIGMGLDASAIRAVQQERFKPAMRGGRPIATPLSINVKFKPAS